MIRRREDRSNAAVAAAVAAAGDVDGCVRPTARTAEQQDQQMTATQKKQQEEEVQRRQRVEAAGDDVKVAMNVVETTLGHEGKRQQQLLSLVDPPEEREEQQQAHQQGTTRIKKERNSFRNLFSSFTRPVASPPSNAATTATRTAHACVSGKRQKWNEESTATTAEQRHCHVLDCENSKRQQQRTETALGRERATVAPLPASYHLRPAIVLQQQGKAITATGRGGGKGGGEEGKVDLPSVWDDRKTQQHQEEEQNAMLFLDVLQQREVVHDPEDLSMYTDSSCSSFSSSEEHKARSSRFCGSNTRRRRSSACKLKTGSSSRHMPPTDVRGQQHMLPAPSPLLHVKNNNTNNNKKCLPVSSRNSGGTNSQQTCRTTAATAEREETETRSISLRQTRHPSTATHMGLWHPPSSASEQQLSPLRHTTKMAFETRPHTAKPAAATAETTATGETTGGRTTATATGGGRREATRGGREGGETVYESERLRREEEGGEVVGRRKEEGGRGGGVTGSSSTTTTTTSNGVRPLQSLNIVRVSSSPHSSNTSDSTGIAMGSLNSSSNSSSKSTRLSSSTAPSSRPSGVETGTRRESSEEEMNLKKKKSKRKRRSSSRSSFKLNKMMLIARTGETAGGGGGRRSLLFCVDPKQALKRVEEPVYYSKKEETREEEEVVVEEKDSEKNEKEQETADGSRTSEHHDHHDHHHSLEIDKDDHHSKDEDEDMYVMDVKKDGDDNHDDDDEDQSSSDTSMIVVKEDRKESGFPGDEDEIESTSCFSRMKAHLNILNVIAFINRVRHQVGNRFFILLLSVFVLVRGVLYGLSHRALLPYLKGLKQDAGIYQSIDALGTVIWGMMGMIGALSDSLPLGGYQKRYYMLIANLLGVAGVCLLAFTPSAVASANIWIVGLGTFLLCTQVSTLVLMCSGKYSEMMEQQPEMKSDVVTFVFTCWMAGNLLGTSIVGPVSDAAGPQPLYFIAVPLAAQSLIPILLGFLPEKRLPFRIMTSRLWKNKRFFAMAAAVGVAATGVVILTIWETSYMSGEAGAGSEGTGNAGEKTGSSGYYAALDVHSAAAARAATEAAVAASNREEGGGSLLMVIYCLLASGGLIGLCCWALPGPLARCNLYLFLWGLLNVSISGALDFFYTAKPSCLPDGPHFDYTYYATLISVVGTLASWAGIWVFHSFLTEWTFRQAFWLTIAVRCIASLFDYVMVLRVNVKYLGIPDKFMYLFGDAIIMHLVNTLNHMPGYILTSRLCPKGLESTAYAVMDGMSHIGWNFSKHVGVYATRLAGISTVETPESPCNFDNLGNLTIITQFALPLLAIPLSFFLLPNQVMSKRFEEQSHPSVENKDQEKKEKKEIYEEKKGNEGEKEKEKDRSHKEMDEGRTSGSSNSQCLTCEGTMVGGSKKEEEQEEEEEEEDERKEERKQKNHKTEREETWIPRGKRNDDVIESDVSEAREKERRREERRRYRYCEEKKNSILCRSVATTEERREETSCCERRNISSKEEEKEENADPVFSVTVNVCEETCFPGALVQLQRGREKQIAETATTSEEDQEYREKEERRKHALWEQRERKRRRGGKGRDRCQSRRKTSSGTSSSSNSERDDNGGGDTLSHPTGTGSSTVTTTKGGERSGKKRGGGEVASSSSSQLLLEPQFRKEMRLQQQLFSTVIENRREEESIQEDEKCSSSGVCTPQQHTSEHKEQYTRGSASLLFRGESKPQNYWNVQQNMLERETAAETRHADIIFDAYDNIIPATTVHPTTAAVGAVRATTTTTIARGAAIDEGEEKADTIAGRTSFLWYEKYPVKWRKKNDRRSLNQNSCATAVFQRAHVASSSSIEQGSFLASNHQLSKEIKAREILKHGQQTQQESPPSVVDAGLSPEPLTSSSSHGILPSSPDSLAASSSSLFHRHSEYSAVPPSDDSIMWERIVTAREEEITTKDTTTRIAAGAAAAEKEEEEDRALSRSAAGAAGEGGMITAGGKRGALETETRRCEEREKTALNQRITRIAAARRGKVEEELMWDPEQSSVLQPLNRPHTATVAAAGGKKVDTATGGGEQAEEEKEEEKTVTAEFAEAAFLSTSVLRRQQHMGGAGHQANVHSSDEINSSGVAARESKKKQEEQKQQQQQQLGRVFNPREQQEAEIIEGMLLEERNSRVKSGQRGSCWWLLQSQQQQQKERDRQQQQEQSEQDQLQQQERMYPRCYYDDGWRGAADVSFEDVEGGREDIEGTRGSGLVNTETTTPRQRGDETGLRNADTGGQHGAVVGNAFLKRKSVRDVAWQFLFQRPPLLRRSTWCEEEHTKARGKQRYKQNTTGARFPDENDAHSPPSVVSTRRELLHAQSLDSGLSRVAAVISEDRAAPNILKEESVFRLQSEYRKQPLVEIAVAQPLDVAVAPTDYTSSYEDLPYNNSNIIIHRPSYTCCDSLSSDKEDLYTKRKKEDDGMTDSSSTNDDPDADHRGITEAAVHFEWVE